jgi:uncharacterized membrane protein YkvA (DUF1232 family)
MQWNESAFWRKLGRHATQAGKRIVYVALLLYYVLVDPDTPMWAKTKCVAALLYFISPFDLIPDFLPGGYLDDLAVLLLALMTVARHVTDDMKKKAKSTCDEWFGPDTPSISGMWKGPIAQAEVSVWPSDMVFLEVSTAAECVKGKAGPSEFEQVEFADGELEGVNFQFTLRTTIGEFGFNLFVEGNDMEGYATHDDPEAKSSLHKVHLSRV